MIRGWETFLLALSLVACAPVPYVEKSCVDDRSAEDSRQGTEPLRESSREAPSSRAPFFDARKHVVDYAGPGREEPPPRDLTEVRIGWFGPMDPEAPLGGSMWCAASLAVEESNREGGLDGLPFRLTGRWSENPWGSGIKGVTELVYGEDVWALIGAPDSASAHLVEQVIAKARVPFLSPVATDKTTNLVNVPWIFACAPGDPEIARVLVDALGKPTENESVALVSGTDHDSRQLSTAVLSRLGRIDSYPGLHVEVRPGEEELEGVLGRVVSSEPDTVIVLAGARESARIVDSLREAGMSAPLLLGPQAGRRAFRKSLASERAGIRLPVLWSPESTGEPGRQFAEKFRVRFGCGPDYAAAYTYDATRLLIQALRDVGMNRARIRDRIRAIPPWDGVTGTLSWAPTGRRSEAHITMGAPRS